MTVDSSTEGIDAVAGMGGEGPGADMAADGMTGCWHNTTMTTTPTSHLSTSHLSHRHRRDLGLRVGSPGAL